MKRIAALLLALILPLAGCGAERDPAPFPAEVPKPEGMFVYRDPFAGGMGTAPEAYGLISDKGGIALPLEYDGISVVTPYAAYDAGDIPASERYFTAIDYPDEYFGQQKTPYDENPETGDDIPAEPEPGDPLAMQPTVALISPEGKLLSDFIYYGIFRNGEADGFIAQRADDPKQFVILDKEGTESPMEDSALLEKLRQDHAWMWNGGELPPTQKEGPDIPESGFDYVLELPGGNYWGRESWTVNPDTGEIITEADSYDGKGLYFSRMLRYSAAGEILSDDAYSWVESAGEGLYAAGVSSYDAENVFLRDDYYILDEEGARLAGPYDSVYYIDLDPYIIAAKDGAAKVIDKTGFREIYTFDPGPDMSFNTFRAGENIVATVYSGSGAPRAFVVNTGEEISFPGLSGNIEACNGGLTRFVVNQYPADGSEENLSMLIDREGNTLAEGYSSLYQQYGTLVGYRYNSHMGIGSQYILDWDGNLLLGAEYSQLEVLPGNAVLAVRGDMIGIADFAGNWLYSEPVFKLPGQAGQAEATEESAV